MEIISNIKIYDLAESIAASGYPMRTSTNEELHLIKKTIKNKTFGKTEETKSIYNRAVNLGNSSGGHDQMLTGIRVAFDLTFSNKAWVEAERYRFLEFVSSQSTMHKITKFDLDTSYIEYVDERMVEIVKEKVAEYNENPTEENYLKVLYSNPCGFRLTAKMTTNYRQLKTIYGQRKTHRLPEWREFCSWIETLPYAKELIIGEKDG